MTEATGNVPGTPQRVALNTGPKSGATHSASILKRSSVKAQSSPSIQIFVPRNNPRQEQAADPRKEISTSGSGRSTPFPLHSKTADFLKLSNGREEFERPNSYTESGSVGCKSTELSEATDQNFISADDGLNPAIPVSERNDARGVAPGKHRMNSSMEPTPSYPRETCTL